MGPGKSCVGSEKSGVGSEKDGVGTENNCVGSKQMAWVPKTVLLICISDSCGASKKSENFKCLKTDL